MDLSGDDVQQRAEADRREVNPQIQVEAAIWTTAGQLALVGEGAAAMVGSRTRRKAVNGWIRAVDLRPLT